MSHFILVHGFNDRSAGRDNIDKVAPGLIALGHTVDCDGEDYGYFSFWQVRAYKHQAVARIVNALRTAREAQLDIILVGYSNGCNYGLRALNILVCGNFKFIAVHPALPVQFKLPPIVTKCWVCFSDSDWAVRLSSYVSWLIPGWGRAGAVGYKGTDSRIENKNYSDIAKGHGGLWQGESLLAFTAELDDMATK